MKDILFITHFTKAPNEKGNGRFHYIAENLDKDKAKVEVVTSSYAHKGKVQRMITQAEMDTIDYKFTRVYEPGYKKNLSVQRLLSHKIFGINLKRYLKIRKKPDVIYCSIPSVDAAYEAAKYAEKYNIPFIIDVQDIWPEAFTMVFDTPIISDVLFYPMLRKANYAYGVADEIIGVSETYANRALQSNTKCQEIHNIPLGTDLTYFDQLAEENKIKRNDDNEIWLGYIGTLGHAYDIECVIDALAILNNDKIKFIVMGDGPLKSRFENHAKNKNVDVNFMGRLSYDKMVGVLTSCDIAVNPISKGAAASLINKHADYAAAGLPVLNTQESEEYRKLVRDNEIGFNCINNNSEDLAEKISILVKDKEKRESMGKNSRMLADKMFNRADSYQPIYDILLK